ncbi:MAG: 5-dehydro-4-deoxy-D-glucuronate isomerase [Bacteroidetes bacterium]|nr:5-dehydro-4-deoxy-D-glucuronate isomerase [Bacteroidota bacterium]
MEIRFQSSPREVKGMNTQQLRDNFLVQHLMQSNQIQLVYSHFDRVIVGGAMPVSNPVLLPNEAELRADYFLERRELGIINVGGAGSVEADGVVYELSKLDALYLGKGTRSVSFSSASADQPAQYFLLSAPAHLTYPNRRMQKDEAAPVHLGEKATSNERTIYKYIHQEGIQSCQLVMGLTVLKEGSVWNSVPPHTHTRRMEVYFYFDLPEAHRVFHLMGEPQETRHIVMANQEAVISPPWSVHCGPGTTNYGFIWAMAGENYTFTDMDPVPIATMQ